MTEPKDPPPARELPTVMCAACGVQFTNPREMYATTIAIAAASHSEKYAVPGSFHRQCCDRGAAAYRDRLMAPLAHRLAHLPEAERAELLAALFNKLPARELARVAPLVDDVTQRALEEVTRAEAKLERANALLLEVARGGGYGLPLSTAERIDEWRQENCEHENRSLSGAGYICDNCGHTIPNEEP